MSESLPESCPNHVRTSKLNVSHGIRLWDNGIVLANSWPQFYKLPVALCLNLMIALEYPGSGNFSCPRPDDGKRVVRAMRDLKAGEERWQMDPGNK